MQLNKIKKTVAEAQHHISTLHINNNGIKQTNSTYNKYPWYKPNCQESHSTIEMYVYGKEMETHLGILDLPGENYNIGHHVIKVADDNNRPAIR